MTDTENAVFGSFGLTLVTGVLLVIMGTMGIFLPSLISLAAVWFLGWLLTFGGIIWGYHTLRHSRGGFDDWLKPVLLIVTGGLMLFNPLIGVDAVALLITVYLLLDSFGSFSMGHLMKPAKGAGWMTFNGVVSLFLAILFLIGWPESSMWLVGIFVGISLLFDGWALMVAAWAFRRSA